MAFTGGSIVNPETVAVAKPKPMKVRSVREIMSANIQTLKYAMENGPQWGMRTGFAQLDDLTFGLHPSRVYTIAGRPGSGKTALQNEVCFNIALEGVPVLLFSMEMDGEDLIERFIANKTGVTVYQQKMGQIPKAKVEELAQLYSRIEHLRFEICDASGVSVQKMIEIIEWFKEKHGVYPALIGTDYIQLMRVSGQSKDVRTDLVGISTSMVEIARNYKAAILQVAQCSRKCEDREDKRPWMSDLAESGQIEADSYFVAFVYREEYYYPNSTKDKGVAEVIVRKNRGGVCKTIKMGFIGDRFKFTDTYTQAQTAEDDKIKQGWTPFDED